MNGTSTDELIRAIYYFFSFGCYNGIVYTVIMLFFTIGLSYFYNIKKNMKQSDLSLVEMVKALSSFRLPLSLVNGVSFMYVLCSGIFYAIINYAILDGIIRFVPFLAFILGLLVSRCLTTKIENIINKIIYMIVASFFFLPINKLIGFVFVEKKKIKKK